MARPDHNDTFHSWITLPTSHSLLSISKPEPFSRAGSGLSTVPWQPVSYRLRATSWSQEAGSWACVLLLPLAVVVSGIRS